MNNTRGYQLYYKQKSNFAKNFLKIIPDKRNCGVQNWIVMLRKLIINQSEKNIITTTTKIL